MPEAFFMSDAHFFHPKVAELRGFTTVEAHNDAIVESIISTVPAGSDLYIIGDNSTGGAESEDQALALLAEVKRWRKGLVKEPYKFHLIPGNHESIHAMHKNSHRRHEQFREVFDSIQLFGQVKLAGQHVLLSHFPYTRDRGRPRYTQWRLRDEGMYLIHGHTHSDERFHGREIHVGWDAWKRPVSGHEIAQYIAKQEKRNG